MVVGGAHFARSDVHRGFEVVRLEHNSILREHAWVEGAYEDVVLMSVLRADQPG